MSSVLVSDTSLPPDDDVLVCLSLSDVAAVPGVRVDDVDETGAG